MELKYLVYKRVRIIDFENTIDSSKGNTKNLWKGIYEITGLNKNKKSFLINSFVDDNSVVKCIRDISDVLNEYYFNLGANQELAVLPMSERVVDDEDYCVHSGSRTYQYYAGFKRWIGSWCDNIFPQKQSRTIF